MDCLLSDWFLHEMNTKPRVQEREAGQVSWSLLVEWMFNYQDGDLVVAAPFYILQQNFKL